MLISESNRLKFYEQKVGTKIPVDGQEEGGNVSNGEMSQTNLFSTTLGF